MRVLHFLLLFFFSSAAPAAPLRLTLNWKAEPQFGGFYAAEQLGLFKAVGLDVKIQEGGSGTPTVQMLASGQTEYAIVSADEIVLAHDRGAKDVIAIFATYQTNPQAILVHAERGYKNLQDLLQDPTATLLWQAGLPYALHLKKKTSKFQVKTAPYLGGIANFQKDPLIAQQCFATSEPLAAKKAGLKVQTFLVAEQGYNPYTTVLAVQASRWKKNPEEVKKMVQAVRQGWASYLKDPKAANQLMQTYNKSMDALTFKESALAQLPLIQTPETNKDGLGMMRVDRWKVLVEQLKELKLIKSSLQGEELFLSL